MAYPRTVLRTLAALLALSLCALAGCRSTIQASGSRPSAAPLEDGRTPAAAFFRRPLLAHVTLSPDGEHIAAIMAQNGLEVLVVRPTAGGTLRPLAKLERSSNRGSWSVRMVGWGSNERLLVSVEMPSPSAVGVRARQSRLLVVDLAGGTPRYLGEDWRYQEYSGFQDNIVSWLPEDPDHVLLSMWMPGQRGAGVRSVNIHSGALTSVVRPRHGALDWAADHRGEVRAGWGRPRTGTERFLFARVDPGDSFDEILRWDPFEEDGFAFAGFSENPETIYVYRDAETGRGSVYTYELASGELGSMVFGHPDVDVGGLRHSKHDGSLLAISYVTDKPRLHFVDESARLEQAAIDQALPGMINRFVSSDSAERRSILQSSSDVSPPTYYLFDREDRRLDPLFAAYPELRDGVFAPMKSIQYEARDGLALHGYLTLPMDTQPPYPTIVYPHGGPWARDVWGWEPVVQFLASRGFAVLQPNFRGSDGYGTEFVKRGYGTWGLEMQDDVTDGVHWLIEQGIADAGRVGIYGASYGGFTALQALIKEPELFRAGASFAGVTDILTLLADDKGYWGLVDNMQKLVGDRWDDRAHLKRVSPALNAEKIRAPVLIAHGTEDWRVHVKQAHAMANALEAEGKQVETFLYEGEVHGFLDERNAIDFYTKLAAFFERHLAPAAELVLQETR